MACQKKKVFENLGVINLDRSRTYFNKARRPFRAVNLERESVNCGES